MNTQMRAMGPEASGEAPRPEGGDSNMGTVPTSGPEATSSQGKHTPGPWHVETVHAETETIAVRESAYGLFIAMVEPHDMEHADAQANARLIAAAPELLAALQDMEHKFDTDPSSLTNAQCHALAAARVVIAKATQP